jgi:hypothetical protein
MDEFEKWGKREMKPKDQKNDRQLWAAVVIVGFVLCAGLTVFHRCTQLGRSLSVDGLAMVGTTLFAAATGFFAILFQVRSASRQLREQLAEQHQASAAESERQRKAVATLLLFEIDGFYATYLRGPRDLLERKRLETDELPQIAPIGPNLFPVYRGNTSKIGELPIYCVQAVVGFFQQADSIVSNLVDYAWSLERDRQFRSTMLDERDLRTIREYRSLRGLAWTQLDRITGALPEAIKLAYLVCHALCQFAGIPFRCPPITVAAEKLSTNEIAVSSSVKKPEGSPERGDAKKN